MKANKLLFDMQKGILQWYEFEANSKVLILDGEASLINYLEKLNLDICCLTPYEVVKKYEIIAEQYDYIIAIHLLEHIEEPLELLTVLKKLLNENGKLILGADNRLGLRYFCGERDPYTKGYFDGIEGYPTYSNCSIYKHGRGYARNEIEDILTNAGFHERKFYSVFPDLKIPQLIYADGVYPNEDLATRYIPLYRENENVFMREELIYDSLIKNKMFHQMANSYFIEVGNNKEFADVKQVTMSNDRGPKYAMTTIIREETVEKRAISIEGYERLDKLKRNQEYLSNRGIKVIDGKLLGNKYVMPFVKEELGNVYLTKLLSCDAEQFIEKMDYFRTLVMESSDIVEENENGPILSKGLIDLVPLNSFYMNNEFYFFDQEYCIDNLPANVILFRTLVIVYDSLRGEPTVPIEFFWDRYNMREQLPVYSKISWDFLVELRNQKALEEYNQKHRSSVQMVVENRKKFGGNMIHTDALREQLLERCFDDIGGRKIYLFGSGRYADEFLAMYQYDYQIAGILDNNSEKWNTELYGITIITPDVLKELNPDDYKVIVCMKNFENVFQQLQGMGTKYVGLYDINYVYPGRQKYLPGQNGLAKCQKYAEEQDEKSNVNGSKKYQVGYIAGVFDLYHLGHLNMFRRAKELCEYLIVGVVSDVGVRNNKKTEPFVPFVERVEMVRSCRYVDEVVEIPYVYCRTPEAYRKYHFDVQFSGSDYENDSGWLAMKDYLNAHGSDLVFFPYTQQTSSTKIKALIEQRLM